MVGDDIEDLTFSSIDYGVRQSNPDEWMIRTINDVVTKPVVFVGTQLDEPTIWQYLEHRRGKRTRGERELRPGSILVTPSVNHARALMLKELNVDWLEMNAKDFAEEVLSQLVSTIEKGRIAIRSRRQSAQRTTYPPLVSDISARITGAATDYLSGQEPQWTDIISGRAIKRMCDPQIAAQAEAVLNGTLSGRPMLLTGTAGSGKSTSLMRLALQLSAKGISTYWIDESSNFEVYRLRDLLTSTQDPVAILADDADIFGRLVTGWARELPLQRPRVLFACAVRSTKVDGLVDRDSLGGTSPIEVSMPLLGDEDIDALISILDKENRLGILKGASPQERRDAFQRQAGRQLLVGMLQATSGLRFSEKAVTGYDQLQGVSRLLYGVICLVHSQRYKISLDELLTSVDSSNNTTLNILERLVTRGIVTRHDRYHGYSSRHRVIAEQVVNSAVFRSEVGTLFEGLFVAFAANLTPSEPRTSRTWRRFIRFINHEFILKFLVAEDVRRAYESIESIMSWDYHFWLQRGSFEVQEEEGDLDLAANFLGQALSLAPGDRLVQAAWSYLLMKKAARRPAHVNARSWFMEGYDTIIGLIEERRVFDPHPYHILGSQTIAWVHAARLPRLEARTLLGRARGHRANGSI